MSDVIALLEHHLVPPRLPGADLISADDTLNRIHKMLADGFTEAGRCWADLNRQRDDFDQLYRGIDGGTETPEAIRALANELEAREHSLAAKFVPGLQEIAAKLAHYRRQRHNPSARSIVRFGEEVIEIGTAWLELFQDTRLRLLRLASLRDDEPPSPVFSDSAAAIEYLRRSLA